MGPAYFVIAILGCADGSTACTPVMTVPNLAMKASRRATRATRREPLTANSNFDYPSLLAQCRAAKDQTSEGEQPIAPPRAETR